MRVIAVWPTARRIRSGNSELRERLLGRDELLEHLAFHEIAVGKGHRSLNSVQTCLIDNALRPSTFFANHQETIQKIQPHSGHLNLLLLQQNDQQCRIFLCN